jgi:hypothetical protein
MFLFLLLVGIVLEFGIMGYWLVTAFGSATFFACICFSSCPHQVGELGVLRRFTVLHAV